MDKIKRYAKFAVAILTAALVAASQVALPIPETARSIVTIVIAALGAVSVYRVPNVDLPVDPESDPDNGPAISTEGN